MAGETLASPCFSLRPRRREDSTTTSIRRPPMEIRPGRSKTWSSGRRVEKRGPLFLIRRLPSSFRWDLQRILLFLHLILIKIEFFAFNSNKNSINLKFSVLGPARPPGATRPAWQRPPRGEGRPWAARLRRRVSDGPKGRAGTTRPRRAKRRSRGAGRPRGEGRCNKKHFMLLEAI